MNLWEYKVILLPTSDASVDEELLNLHGSKGWELVSVSPTAGSRTCFFKRPATVAIPDAETVSMPAVSASAASGGRK